MSEVQRLRAQLAEVVKRRPRAPLAEYAAVKLQLLEALEREARPRKAVVATLYGGGVMLVG